MDILAYAYGVSIIGSGDAYPLVTSLLRLKLPRMDITSQGTFLAYQRLHAPLARSTVVSPTTEYLLQPSEQLEYTQLLRQSELPMTTTHTVRYTTNTINGKSGIEVRHRVIAKRALHLTRTSTAKTGSR